MLESLLNKVAGLKACSSIKNKFLRILYFEKYLQTTASASQVFFNDFYQKCSTTIYVVIRNDKRFFA